MNETLKRILPHIIALVLMFGLSSAFFSPYVFQGKVVNQFDNVQARGMQTEIFKYHNEHDETILWTNGAFAGLPTYQIHLASPGNLIVHPFGMLLLYQGVMAPHSAAFVGMLCMYLLLIVLRVDWRLAIGGAVALGLCNYNMDLFIAGHSTKILALAYLSAVIAGVILIFRKQWMLGGTLYGLAFALQLCASHLQITYYTGLLVGIFVLINIVFAFIDKDENIIDVLKSIGVLVAFSLIGFATSLPKTWATQEYSKESQRGTSELAAKKGQDGLSADYGMSYSLTFKEALLPSFASNYYGGGREHNTIEGTKLYKETGASFTQSIEQQNKLSKQDAELEAKKMLASYIYTGNDFTPGVSIYFGIIVWFLFIIGIVLVPGKEKWWLLLSALFMFMISMGGNFSFNEFLFNNFPLFNKFRAMSMAMGLVQLLLIVLAFYGGQKLFDKEIDIAKRKQALYIGAGVTFGMLVLMLLSGNMGDFTNARDANLSRNYGQGFIDLIYEDRIALMRRDVLRGMLLLVLSAGLIWAFLNHKIKSVIAIVGIVLLTIIDVWTVSKRVSSDDKFKFKNEVAGEIAELEVDKQIKAREKDIHYRVLDLAAGKQNPYSDARASYHHKSIGGYFSAKLMIYEELKNTYLSNPMANKNILGMLNTKYIIGSPQSDPGRFIPFPVPEACGNAWFVKEYQMVPDADAELNGLSGLDTKNKALIQTKYSDYMAGFNMNFDSTATIKLTNYHPDRMEYTYSSNSEQLAMFSEMFYPPSKGWDVYLNDEKITPFIKANFAIRGMRLPAGQNQKLEMRFEPRSYYLGNTIALISSLLILIGFLAALFLYFKKNEISDPTLISNDPLPEKIEKAVVKPTKFKTTKDKRNKKKER